MIKTANLVKIKQSLQNGNLCILPTDTILGIFANATNHEAVQKIFTAKQRDSSKPLAIFPPNSVEISKYGIETEMSRAFVKENLPGAYTILLKATQYAKSTLSPLLISQDGKIGIRIPNKPDLLSISQVVIPCGTSVNISGEIFATEEIPSTITKHVEFLYTTPTNNVMSQTPSTIIDFTQEIPSIVRS